ncbi:7,8-dihydroneopterin aldolase [Novimethylophilus kurashikiensis]|uniref:7,8-dihydroneopterin aldolase n=1 Tax=Novimethylophilus kurashikiensis TaxID=1825523 RepID=A0A2R5FCA4_9PROT|nr:Rap1a/Tai family immunity protein [Novimethylophilus kurashikiensis]GBG15645.1 7,8-dihydroneopterin aldolase [Novimethylophilus kurashikiensis]
MNRWIWLLALLLPQIASADNFETGQDLYALCKQAADPAKRNDLAFGLCMGYIDGYISGYRFKKEIEGSPQICSDIEKRSRRQVLKAVVDHLGEHQEDQKELKSIAMYRALLDKMTCPGEKGK